MSESSFLRALSTSASGMAAQSQRLRVVSENVANVDTPGYRRKLVTFVERLDRKSDAKTVRLDRVTLSNAPLREELKPDHPMADANGMVAMSNVNVLIEVADAREAQRSYEANMNLFDQARRMYGNALDLLRR